MSITHTSHDHHGVTNRRQLDYSFNSWFRLTSMEHHHQAPLAPCSFAREIHQWPADSPHKWPAMRKALPYQNVIMRIYVCILITILRSKQKDFTLHICKWYTWYFNGYSAQIYSYIQHNECFCPDDMIQWVIWDYMIFRINHTIKTTIIVNGRCGTPSG